VRAARGDVVKVLHVIPSVAPCYGGPSRAVIEMCRALRRAGVDTLIATTDADGAKRLPVKLIQIVSYDDAPAIFFPRQWSEAYKYSRPLARWLDSHVADYDVVHIHAVFSHACLAAARACRKSGVPYVVRPLGTLDPWSLRQKSLKKKLFWHLSVRRMLDGAAAIHYTARPEQEMAEESLGLARGVVVPLGVDLDSTGVEGATESLQVLDSPFGRSPYMLVLSRLHHTTGLDLLVPTFLSLAMQPEFSEWRLILAGEGDAEYVGSLRSLIESQGPEGHIVFAGWLEGARKMVALRQASVLALTSYQENFGLCLVEALACGVPVVVSPHVNLAPEIEEAGAGWVAPLERGALEHTLTEIMRDAQARARRGAAGRELVHRRFTWSAVADQLVAVYTRAALTRGRGRVSTVLVKGDKLSDAGNS
jgi:glycosyltransferase involved in cell wall biosynthesis